MPSGHPDICPISAESEPRARPPLVVVAHPPAQLTNPLRNLVLGGLNPDDFAAMEPFLRLIPLRANEVICGPERPIERVLFPVVGAIASQMTMRGGRVATGSCMGREGALGVGSAFNAHTVRFPMIAVLPGEAWQIGSVQLRELVSQRPTLRHALLSALDDALHRAELSAVCGQLHDGRQRLASMLLINRHRSSSSTLELTQEALSAILGVQRTSITAIALSLKSIGAIAYRRGKVRIIDLDALQGAACECHLSHPLFGATAMVDLARDRWSA